MTSSIDITDVVFRVFPEGDVIALFPNDIGNYSEYTCSSYMSIGQHGSADPWLVVRTTRLAKPIEYTELKAELERLGYTLQVKQRIRQTSIETRRKLLSEIR